MSSIEKEERLLALPTNKKLQMATPQDVPANYSPIYEDDVFHEGRSLREYFLVIYKRLPIILAMTILVTAAVAFYMYRLPSMYESATTMVIELPKPKPQSNREVYINLGYDNNYVNTQLRLLKTPELMREVVLRLGLYKDPNLFGKANKGFIDSLRSIFNKDTTNENKETSLPVLAENTAGTNAADISTLTAEEKARVDLYTNILLGGLNIDQIPTTDLVNVRLQSTNQDLIPKVTNTLAQVHIERDADNATKGAVSTFKDLSKSIEELKASVSQKELQRLNEMAANNLPLTGSDKSADFNSERLQKLSGQYLEAEDDRRKLQAEYDAASAAINKGITYAGVSRDGEGYISKARENILKMRNDLTTRLDSIDKQITDAEAKLEQLRVRYQDDYNDVKQAKALVTKLKTDRKNAETEGEKKIAATEKNLIKDAASETLTSIQSKLAAAQRRVAELKNEYFSAIGVSQKQGVATTKLTTLNSEIDTERNLLNTYVQKQKEMELTISSGRPDNISVTSPAPKPDFPIGPQRNRNIFIAFLLTFGIGIGLAFLLDYLDDSVKTSDDIGKHLGLPTLALIPHQSILEKRKKKGLPGISNPSSTALITLEDSRSAMAEAYRHLRTSLLFSSAGKPPQTVLVTSSQPSEGKTTTAINTAITLAQAGADVVIIDCDLRRPRLHSHFGMENTTGLTNYLSGDKNTDELLRPYPTFPKLKVITSGPIPPNPAELLSSTEMKELLRDLKGKFNHIVVDSPPAISFADAAILSTVVDGVILVAMSGKSSIQLIKRFKQRLNTIGTRIYGVVLNGIKPDSLEYGYYGYGYGYNYGYGYDYDDEESTPRMEDTNEINKQ
ncbi:MAG TPA: polysaccharide biosynthesis tyrosine autokinase [Pyrinomonadaceae bacterium]|nr:polysaccharide biosynthesis tyrosine autokinase [Pyrinomonadaceae bacterium]